MARTILFSIILIMSLSGINAGPDEELKLYNTICQGTAAEVKALLKSGVSANSITYGGTPLIKLTNVLGCGIYKEKPGIVRVLLEHGADPMLLPAGSSCSAVYWAVRNGMGDIAVMLIEKSDFSKDNGMAFTEAVGKGEEKYVEMMLKRGASVNGAIISADGAKIELRPLLAAASRGDVPQIRIAKILLAKGADINIRGENGDTALMSAAMNNNCDFIKLLLANKASVNLKNRKGQTALDFALAYNAKEAAQILKAAGAVRGKGIKRGREM